MHSLGIVHRDIKPGNLFIDDMMEVKLGDFGLSMRLEESTKQEKEDQIESEEKDPLSSKTVVNKRANCCGTPN